MHCSACRSPTAEVDSVLSRIHAGLLQSTLGFAGFGQKLLRLDMTGTGAVSAPEVRLALGWAGAPLAAEDAAVLEARFSTTQAGVVDARALLARLEALDKQTQG
jgi:hypothetical protein